MSLARTTFTPSAFDNWFINDLDFENGPVIKKPEEYAKQWLNWWNSIQHPQRRRMANDILPLPEYPSYYVAPLRAGGKYGLGSLLIALFWWGKTGKSKRNFWVAVQDFRKCVEALMPQGIPVKRASTKTSGSKQVSRVKKGKKGK